LSSSEGRSLSRARLPQVQCRARRRGYRSGPTQIASEYDITTGTAVLVVVAFGGKRFLATGSLIVREEPIDLEIAPAG
jgi:hypothetical protein